MIARGRPRRQFKQNDAMNPPSLALQSPPLPAAMKLRRVFRPLAFRLWHRLQLLANRKPGRVRVCGLELFTHPEVFNPAQHFSSRILAEYVAALPLNGCRVLDVGTGSGIIGLAAARRGAEVVALDLNPRAAALAKKNARANGFRSRFKVLCGDLLQPLSPAARFDWMIFNPPFFDRPSASLLQGAYNAGAEHQTIARFLQQARALLAPAGIILLILSSDMKIPAVEGLLARQQYRIAQIQTRLHVFEVFYLIHLRRHDGAPITERCSMP